jgi:hypothetical protein
MQADLLMGLTKYFGVGTVRINKKTGSVNYSVSSLKDLTNVILPHFIKYPLITQKCADFVLFKRIVDLMNRGEHLTSEGLAKIVSIKASINKGLSKELKATFANIDIELRPEVVDQKIKNPNWLTGFVEAEGCFNVSLSKAKPQLRIQISQNLRDRELVSSIVTYLGCGFLQEDPKSSVVKFIALKFDDVYNIVIPFFNKYPLIGYKNLDFKDFCKIAVLVQNKAHLTTEGIEEIQKIKSKMNIGRDNDEIITPH